MNISKQKNAIEQKFSVLLYKKFDAGYLSLNALTDKEGKETEKYKLNLKMFKYLFRLKDKDARVFLWNSYYPDVVSLDRVVLDKKDFTQDELKFFNEMFSYHKNFKKKYGDHVYNKFNINKIIETSRLILKPYDNELNKQYNDYFIKNKKEYEKYYGREYNEVDISTFCNPQYKQLFFAVILKETNEYIGNVGLEEMNQLKYNIEYYIMPKHRKKGYAFEALQEVLKLVYNKKLLILSNSILDGVYSKTHLNIKCISAWVNSSNVASIKLLEKLGFKKDGVLKYDREFYDEFMDTVVYTLEL